MKVALVYDRVNKWGGAERVMLALRELFPSAPLYTSVYNKKKASWANEFQVKTSFLQNIPLAISNHELFALFMPIAFESFNFDDYDLVISVTSESAKGIITKPPTRHICYCLTPTRYLWSGYNEYFKKNLFKFITLPAVAYLRKWDAIAANRPDIMISLSNEVRKRVKKYYGRDSEIIYPPLTLNSYSAPASQKNEDYFLIVSRLVGYKRIDLAIKACNYLKLPLKIIGKGIEERKLRQMSGPTIEFLGTLRDKELVKFYSNCKALIFPGIEDFGLTVIEAQKFGKSVIAFRGGGALETIREGKTGLYFDYQTTGSLIGKLKEFDKYRFSALDCKQMANKFSVENFKKKFIALVGKRF